MKVCHVTSVHPRHDIRICEKECVSLAKRGYDTYLVVNDGNANEEYKGIHILSTGIMDTGRVGRIINAPKRVLELALSVDADVYQLHDPELLLISDKLMNAGKKVVFDAHEDTEKQIENKYWIPTFIRLLVGKLYGWYSIGKFRRMTALISVTPSIVNKLKKYNSNVFFAGGILEQWCHDNIIEAVKKVDGIMYQYAGRGRKEYLARLQGIKANYLGLLSHEDVMETYKDAVAGMVLLKSDTQVGKDGTLGNTKIFEVMEAGRPVICSDLKLWREIIEKYNCGICVNPEDIASISDAIRYLAEHPDEGDSMGRNGKKAVEEEFNWATQEKELYAFYEKIAGLP